MRFLKLKEIKPRGWLKKQLEIQANGLNGHLDQIWPDVRDSKWIGGECEGWERVPYWLDGFIPLAYILDDEGMISRAKKYIDAILINQQEDGWICPCKKEERNSYDLWALFLILKVLTVYGDCSGDERIEGCVYRALKQLHGFLKERTTFGWASARWYECLIPIKWLYERRPEEWLKKLAKRLRIRGFDYSKVSELWKENKSEWSLDTHVVNAAMSLKGEALYKQFAGEPYEGEAEKLYSILQKYHGTAYGHFTGDECLAGTSPIRGSELCGVVEAMCSYEWLFSITENPLWGEALESLAFNALPATTSEDMWTHQYDQMSNQIACIRFPDAPIFGTNNAEANRFGLEPNFGCCTANFGQGWPKFASSLIGKDDAGLVVLSCVPFVSETKLNGGKVSLSCEGEYPFRNKIELKVNNEGDAPFTLRVRIPACTKASTKLMTQNGGFLVATISRGETSISIQLQREPELFESPCGLSALRYGPLVFALPLQGKREKVEYTENGVQRRFPYCDYDIYPTEPWGYAFSDEKFTVEECEFDMAFSRSNPPLKIYANMVPIAWGDEDGHRFVAANKPKSDTPTGKKQRRHLQPYGATTLRMTEMPTISAKKQG